MEVIVPRRRSAGSARSAAPTYIRYHFRPRASVLSPTAHARSVAAPMIHSRNDPSPSDNAAAYPRNAERAINR